MHPSNWYKVGSSNLYERCADRVGDFRHRDFWLGLRVWNQSRLSSWRRARLVRERHFYISGEPWRIARESLGTEQLWNSDVTDFGWDTLTHGYNLDQFSWKPKSGEVRGSRLFGVELCFRPCSNWATAHLRKWSILLRLSVPICKPGIILSFLASCPGADMCKWLWKCFVNSGISLLVISIIILNGSK